MPYQVLYITVDNYKRGDCVKIYGYIRKKLTRIKPAL